MLQRCNTVLFLDDLEQASLDVAKVSNAKTMSPGFIRRDSLVSSGDRHPLGEIHKLGDVKSTRARCVPFSLLCNSECPRFERRDWGIEIPTYRVFRMTYASTMN